MLAYRLLIILLSPLILGHLLIKSQRFNQPQFFWQRLGFGLNHIPESCTWFHCASVGETNAVLPLVQELHRRNNARCFLITTNTITGAEIVARQKQSWLLHSYLPMDWVSTTKRFIKHVKPVSLTIVETELWPNLIDVCHQRRVPVTIINGRLSKKTTLTNKWIRSVYKRTLELVKNIYVRSELDRDLYIELGAANDSVSLLGNLKYIPPNSMRVSPQEHTPRDYIVIASTHEGEELKIAKVWDKLHRSELLVIAPRHPDRSSQIIKQLETVVGNVDKYVAVRSKNDAINRETKIYILDSVGELTSWYSAAKLIVMAGSFIHRGGHNILEPAHFGKAIIVGPHMENFVDENKLLLDNDAAVQVFSTRELEITIPRLLDNETERKKLEQNALKAVKPFSNVIADYADVINQ